MTKLPNSYFPHDFNARLDRKILRLRKVLGIEGYGIFWMLIETLCTEENFSYPMKDIDLLADDFGCSVEKIEAVIKQFSLFEIDKEAKFFSLSLITRLQKYLDISETARNNINKRWEKARLLKEMNTPVLPPYNESNTIKEKDIKEKKIKGEDGSIHEYEIPKKEQVIKAFLDAGYPEDEAKSFFGHYDSKGWLDTKNNPIKYWTSLIEVWMLRSIKFDKNNTNNKNAPKRIQYRP